MNLSLGPFEKLVEDPEIRPFTSVQSLEKRLNDALRKDKPRNQHLIFTDVPEAWALRLSDDSCQIYIPWGAGREP